MVQDIKEIVLHLWRNGTPIAKIEEQLGIKIIPNNPGLTSLNEVIISEAYEVKQLLID